MLRIQDYNKKRIQQYVPKMTPDFYSLEEIRDKVELETKTIKVKKEETSNEMILIKQLLKNVQKNKLNITRDYFDSDKLSI